MGNDKVTSGRRAKKLSQVSGQFKILIIVGIVAIGSILGITGYLVYNYVTSQAQAPGTLSATTISLECYVSGEDVSWVPVHIWFPKASSDFDDPENIYTKGMYELEVTLDEAEDISIDVSGVPYWILEIDPSDTTVYLNTEFVKIGGINQVIKESVYDRATDFNFNVLDATLDEIDLTADFTNQSTSANYTIIMDIPHYTTTLAQMHYGADWVTKTSVFNDLDATDKLWFYDEANYACLAPSYDTSVDTDKDFDDELERFTNCAAFKFDFNTTLSTVDGNTANVNFTVGNEVPAEVVFSGDLIYLIFYDVISFENGAVNYLFEMQTGTHIELDDVDSGWIIVPGDDDTVSTFTKASDIGA